MIDFFSCAQNFPFSVALAVMIIIAIVEVATSLFGASFSHLIHGLFHESSFGLDSADIDSSTLLGKVFLWLKIGQIPFIILVIMFLAIFGITGLILQSIFLKLFGYLLPAFLVSMLTLTISFPSLITLGTLLNNVMPKDETSAVSLETFIGRTAIITLGTAKCGYAAEAKVKDSFGKYHYIMVQPDNEGETFTKGNQVLIVRRDKNQFYVIENNHHVMVDE